MKSKKERRHAVKQANTLETSRKVLQKATMDAIHKGGFLFSNNENGAMAPVIVNATVQQILVAVLAFLFSRTATHKDTTGLYDYIIATADSICKMRLKDVPAEDAGSKG